MTNNQQGNAGLDLDEADRIIKDANNNLWYSLSLEFDSPDEISIAANFEETMKANAIKIFIKYSVKAFPQAVARIRELEADKTWQGRYNYQQKIEDVTKHNDYLKARIAELEPVAFAAKDIVRCHLTHIECAECFSKLNAAIMGADYLSDATIAGKGDGDA